MTDQAQQPAPPAPASPPASPVPAVNRAPGQTRRWYADPLLIALLVAVFATDQITKSVVVAQLRLGESWPVDGFFRITYARNTGTAFGLFQNQTMILTIISIIAVAAILFFYRSAITSTVMRAALGLQLGGAFGNLLDRIRLGYVVDFVDVGPWPIFNVADSSIVVGIAILAWYFGFRQGAASGAGSQRASPSGQDGGGGQGVER